MAQIVIWLKHLIAMVVLAGFLELVLPDNQLKNVTKLILGLAIMLLLLQPLSKFYQLPATLTGAMAEAVSRAPTTPATAQVIREGLILRQKWQGDFGQTARQGLEDKLRQIFTLWEGVFLRRVTWRYAGTKLNRVILTVAATARDPLSAETRSRLQRQIVRSVQLVTELPSDKIEIAWSEQNGGSWRTGF